MKMGVIHVSYIRVTEEREGGVDKNRDENCLLKVLPGIDIVALTPTGRRNIRVIYTCHIYVSNIHAQA